MIRTVTLAASFLTAFSLVAQWAGGPLTLSTSPMAGLVHRSAVDYRGGPPYNDECQNAVINALPPNGTLELSGNNLGATDTENFGNPNVWEAFSIDTCSTVTVSYCGIDPAFTLVYSILIIGCPSEVSVQNTGTEFCADGNTTITYANLAAGTYYIPVLLWPGEAEGAYTITLSSAVCTEPPPNDRCIDAITLPVVANCGDGGTVTGNNSVAVQNGGPPSCQGTNTQFQDVWYQFNSGDQEEVLFTLGTGTTSDLGIEVLSGCGGMSLFCASGDTSYLVPVLANTFYKVRVFSNNDFGTGGVFTICVSVPETPIICEGGTISLAGGSVQTTVCAFAQDTLVFLYDPPGTAQTALVLTGPGDTVLAVWQGGSLATDTLALGTYRVWGISYEGDLPVAGIGAPLDSLASTTGCLALSVVSVSVSVEICQGVEVPVTTSVPFHVQAGPAGWELVWEDVDGPVDHLLMDAHGALIATGHVRATPGGRSPLTKGGLPSGLYLVNVQGAGHGVRRFIVP
jgi:hypothetical protein